MSLTTIYSVFCDQCQDWIGQSESASGAREHARAFGWKRRKVDGKMLDLCSVCAETACKQSDFGMCVAHQSAWPQGHQQCLAMTQHFKGKVE